MNKNLEVTHKWDVDNLYDGSLSEKYVQKLNDVLNDVYFEEKRRVEAFDVSAMILCDLLSELGFNRVVNEFEIIREKFYE